MKMGVQFTPGDGRSAKEQAAYQIAALAVTLGISLIGGLITGITIVFLLLLGNMAEKYLECKTGFRFYVLVLPSLVG